MTGAIKFLQVLNKKSTENDELMEFRQVLFLISFPGLTGQIFVVWPWFFTSYDWIPTGQFSEWFKVFSWLILFNVLLGGLYVNYYLACATDPGGVPHDWVIGARL